MGVVAMRIPTGAGVTGANYATFVHGHMAQLADAAGVAVPFEITIADVPPLEPLIAQGRWVVDCPDCGLNRSMVWDESPSLYMCVHCWNVSVGGDWRPVAFPENRDEVERALLERPFPQDRNYLPTETVEALEAQTAIMLRKAA